MMRRTFLTSALDMPEIMSYIYSKSWKLQFSASSSIIIIEDYYLQTFLHSLSKIEKLSKHIFINDPFDVIFLDATNKTAYEQLKALRNYIAHESGEAKSKLINLCFSGNSNNFLEPNDFLTTRERSTRNTYYTYYINIIENIVDLLVDPPT